MWLHSLKVAQLLRSAACLHTNQSRSYLNHLVYTKLHSVIQHKALISIFTAVRALSLTLSYSYLFYLRISPVMWGDLRLEVYKLFIHMVESFLLPGSKGSLIRISKAYYIVVSTPESGSCGNGTIYLRGREKSV